VLLRAGSEIEHALLVEYLYAAWSLGPNPIAANIVNIHPGDVPFHYGAEPDAFSGLDAFDGSPGSGSISDIGSVSLHVEAISRLQCWRTFF
jgi:hypothetical protein